MNIYFCHEYCDDCGLFVAAPTSRQAKAIFARETDVKYIDTRAYQRKCGANIDFCGIMHPEDKDVLEKFNLEYADENKDGDGNG